MAKIRGIRGYVWFGLFGFVILNVTASNLFANETDIDVTQLKMGLDTVWVLLGAFLVFFIKAL